MTAFGLYEYKHSFKEEEAWKKVNILKKGKNKQIVIANECNIPYLPVQNHPLKKAKVENIKELLAFIPAPYQPFYEEIISLGGENEPDDSDGSSDSD